jgi:hypothetical protein
VAYEFLEMFTTFKIQRFICANNDTWFEVYRYIIKQIIEAQAI